MRYLPRWPSGSWCWLPAEQPRGNLLSVDANLWQVDEVQCSLVGQLFHADGAPTGIEMDQRIRVLLRRVHLGRGSPAREDKGDLLTQALDPSCQTIPLPPRPTLHRHPPH